MLSGAGYFDSSLEVLFQIWNNKMPGMIKNSRSGYRHPWTAFAPEHFPSRFQFTEKSTLAQQLLRKSAFYFYSIPFTELRGRYG